jgi:hypothetical protein
MRKLFFSLLFIGLCQSIAAQDTLLLITGKKIVVSSVDLSGNTIAYRKMEAGSKLKTIDPERVFSITYRDGNERIIYMPDSLDPIDFKVEEMRNFIRGEQDARELYKNTPIKVAGVAVGAGSAMLGLFYGLIGPPIYSTVVGSYSPNIEKKLTFEVSGNAADELGISSGKYLNNISGTKSAPVIKKGQQLSIGGTKVQFKEDTPLDSTVSLINSKFKCTRIHAANDNGKINLYKASSTAIISDPSYREGFEKNVRDYKIKNAFIFSLGGFIAGFITYNLVAD